MPKAVPNTVTAAAIILGLLALTGVGGCGGTGGNGPTAVLPAASETPRYLQIAAAHGEPVGWPSVSDVPPPTAKPYFAALDQLRGRLLVVITYGNGWSAKSSGDGLKDIADALRRGHPNRQVITRGCNDDDQIRKTIESHVGPVALVGHSFGGCRSVELAASLRRPVDSLILLDPVPCDDWAFQHPGKYFHVPESVRSATCFYRGAGMVPMSYPINNPRSPGDNRLREMGHGDFCRDAEVRQYILEACAVADGGR